MVTLGTVGLGDRVVAVGRGDRGVRQVAVVRVQAAGQGRVGAERVAPAAVGELDRVVPACSRTTPPALSVRTIGSARKSGQGAGVRRASLLAILGSAVPAEALRPGITVREARPDGTVLHSGGESRADLVIGADGVRSAIRRSVWPNSPAPRYAGYTSWRVVTGPVPVGEAAESWGRGERFGYASLPDGRIYCYATANAPEGAPGGGLAGLRGRFAGWHDPIPALLDAADAEAVLHHDVYELPPLKEYVRGRVVLTGDAAHAMTPNLGQGACQALEDAVVLSDVVANGDGLDAYDRQRRARTQMITRRARRIGAAGQWSSPVAVHLRDSARRPAGDPGDIAARAIGRLASLRLGPLAVGYLLTCSVVNWVADALCLAAAIAAASLTVPWGKLLLAWSVAAGASTLSPTPFGLGVVEPALIAARAAAGTSSPRAVGAVLLYRIITFKIAGLIWVAYRCLQERAGRP